MDTFLEPEALHQFDEAARAAVYDAIALRRDIRHFRSGLDVAPDVLERILGAAHRAPSVGFSQPWGFVIVRDLAVRARIRDSFMKCREAEAARFPVGRRESYLAHRLEGILEAPVNLCVAVDLRSRGEAILGTTVQPESVRASACCAVQNLWLAARVEGIGVGWVSIVEPAVLRAELGLPPGVEPIAYLCLGHARAFRERPMLEESGWLPRKPLEQVVHPDGRWIDRNAPELVPEPSPAPCASGIPEVSAAARLASTERQASLTKPAGSLGRLEEISAWYAAARGTYPPRPPEHAVLALFAADHGVVVEGVSAYGSMNTAAVVANVMAGGAAVNALARSTGVAISLIDVGIAGDLSAAPRAPLVPLGSRRVRRGTGNLRREPAMTLDEAARALEAGAATAREAILAGADLLSIGEIGIGNTTAAAALAAAFAGVPASAVVGRGTGIADEVRARKVRVVEDALALHQPDHRSPLERLALLGGLEIAAMAGAILEAARRRIPVVLDGFVTGAAALVAVALEPGVRPYLLASHLSPEPGARVVLDRLELRPLLDLEMRLGEGTGGLLAVSMVRAAVDLEQSMATFATAGVVGRPGTDLGAAQ
jgi:nicotinate-nucleotide--dimethylbenzimidazole phosphoribosyltransferase